MIILGVKLSHDGAVALIEDGVLRFSIEAEKVGGAPRYARIDRLELIEDILEREGVRLGDIDQIVVDGWYDEAKTGAPSAPTSLAGCPLAAPTARYVDAEAGVEILDRATFDGAGFGPLSRGYASYPHVAGHVMGAYAASPAARQGEDALVLAWDGGMLPMLHSVSAAKARVEALGPLFPFVGNVFAAFSKCFEPYRRDKSAMSEDELARFDLETPGKAMAYAALGAVTPAVFPVFDALFDEIMAVDGVAADRFGEAACKRRDSLFPGLSSADLIASFQAYLGEALLEAFKSRLKRLGGPAPHLVLSGGCALNIKWNSRLRDSGLFASVWAPPFTNDSGGAIGAAMCEAARMHGRFSMDWSVYAGPALGAARPPDPWRSRACDEAGLARLLHETREPVAVLGGRAELGPRALGNRSLLAAPGPEMKAKLNAVKGREDYRPVAPICLEDRAADVFRPGGRDPYMLFEHRPRPEWEDRIPAVVHLDGTARLQTLAHDAPGTRAGAILKAYEALSGSPVLCNTSANDRGRGFLPDAASAARWGRTAYVWSEGVLYASPSAPDAATRAEGALA